MCYNSPNEKAVKIDDYTLICPSCGGNNLHHHTVEIFNRTEDAATGVHIKAEVAEWNHDNDLKDTAMMDTNMEENPSKRRQGISIGFLCETCDGDDGVDMVLDIVQHKGSTYMFWRGSK